VYGAIIGDIVGSCYERPGGGSDGMKNDDFVFFEPPSPYTTVRFTDDTVLTCAVAHTLMTGQKYVDVFHDFVRREPKRGYGPRFGQWVRNGERKPYFSFGNGSTMRVSPVGWFCDSLDEVLAEAKRSAEVTHDHPEGIKGAQAVASAIWAARTGSSKASILLGVMQRFGYNLNRTLDDIRPTYKFDVSCQGSVPEAILAFAESEDYDSTIRNAVSLGGDTDTQACIAGSIAEAFYGGVPKKWKEKARSYLTPMMLSVADEFDKIVQKRLAEKPQGVMP
jgi:ADP-ribosylglycohydrolase